MRSLIPFLLIALVENTAVASPGIEASYHLGLRNPRDTFVFEQASAPGQLSGLGPEAQIVQNTFGILLKKLAPDLDVATTFQLDHPNYSAIRLTDRRGNLYSPESKTEAQFQVEGTFSRAGHLVGLGFFGHAGVSPYALRGVEARLGESFLEGSTWVLVDGSYFSQSRPADYYINDRFRSVERPRLVHAHDVGVAIEQWITERWKGRLRVSTSQRAEERPRNFGVEATQSYALTERLFARLDLRHYRELRGEGLRNERGYFQSYQLKGELTLEPFYDVYLSASYSVTVEHEDDPRSGRALRAGTDQYGFGLRYPFGNLTLDAQGAYEVTNWASSFLQFSGGFTWII